MDSGQTQQAQSSGQKQTATAPAGHKVGDIITQNGQHMKVTSVDASGKVTGAE